MLEVKYLGNHNDFGHIIIFNTILEEELKKKYKISKRAMIGTVLSSNKENIEKIDKNLYKLLEVLVKNRNNLVHNILENELYGQIYSGNSRITDTGIISFQNSILSTEGKKFFGTFYQVEIKPYLDNSFFETYRGQFFFPSLYGYCISLLQKEEK